MMRAAMTKGRPLWAIALALCVSTTVLTDQRRHLSLGPSHLSETRTTQRLAPGLTYTRIVRGHESANEYHTVFIFRATLEEAQALAQQLHRDGYQAEIERIRERAFDDPVVGPLGWRINVGRFAIVEQANAQRDALAADGYSLLRVAYTGEDGKRTTGPWVVHVLEIDRSRFSGQVAPVLASGMVPANAPLSSIDPSAVAAINGGYFVIGAGDGTPGDLAGISMIAGELVSEAVRRRTSLLLHSTRATTRADIAALSTRIVITAADGTQHLIDGLNRKPGLVRGCGGTGDTPTDEPKHDFTCTDSGELILFRPAFGTSTEPGDGIEVVLAESGAVVEVRASRGGVIPAIGSVLSATGDAAEWLGTHVTLGSLPHLRAEVLNVNGRALRLDPDTGIINGGPRLLRRGEIDITATAEGFHWPENPEFYYRFGGRRNPRTLAGVAANGDLLLVAVDGRQPGYSVGATFEESATIMRALGARDAVNLDGGGSTTITVNGHVVNRPSDATGERPIGDAIVIQP